MALLFLVLMSNSFAGIVNECTVVSLWNDWRTIAVGAMAITAGFIAFLYMYGSVVDNSFIARAKNELFQLLATAVLVTLFVVMVAFMCSSIIPDMFGYSEVKEAGIISSIQDQNIPLIQDLVGQTDLRGSRKSIYQVGESYLLKVSGYVQRNFIVLIGFQMLITQGGTIGGDNISPIGKGLVTSTKFLNEAIGLSVATNMMAYLITVTQLSLLDYIRLISLTVMLPVGIVLRGFYPFRSFGGSLIGIAIAFYIMVPFLLILNDKMMSPIFDDQPQEIGQNICLTDNECYSQKCVLREDSQSGNCAVLKSENAPDEERTCTKDRECIKENCYKGLCTDCGGFGQNPIGERCCKGFVVDENSGRCVIGKKIEEKCIYPNHLECISGYCNPSGKCELRKATDIEECNENVECWYGRCSGDKCLQTILNSEDVYQIRGRDAALSRITGTDYDAKPTTSSKPGEQENILSGYLKSAIGGLIAGLMLPALNLVIISASIKSFSAFFGSEINLEKLWKII